MRILSFAVMLTVVLVAGFLLASCATAPIEPPMKLSPICEALGPKFKFNPHNQASPYHAGPKLAPRLSQQNDIHDNLRCKE